MLHLREFRVERSAVKQVTCEKCGHAFEYLLNLEMKIATIPIPALMRRQALAYGKILDRRVAQEVEPVSCPSCGWMQSAMVETLRRRSFRGLKLWGALLSIASGVLAIVFLAVGIYSRFRPLGVDLDCFGIAGAGAAGAAFGVLLIAIRWFISGIRYSGEGFSCKQPIGDQHLALIRSAA